MRTDPRAEEVRKENVFAWNLAEGGRWKKGATVHGRHIRQLLDATERGC